MTNLFQKRIDAAMIELKRFEKAAATYTAVNHTYSTKESAALKRASMDLSRALTQVRKGNY